MAVFYGSRGAGGLWHAPHVSLPIAHVRYKVPQALGSRCAVVIPVSYAVGGASPSDLEREASYEGVEIPSLGIQPWNDVSGPAKGYLEFFGLADVEPGGTVDVTVAGFALSPRSVRSSAIVGTGVEALGEVVKSYGTGDTLTCTGNAPAAGIIVQAFAARSGLAGYTQQQRYLDNTGIALMIGDAEGTGSSVSFGATMAKAGPWAGMSVVLEPADIVATVKPLVAEPILKASGRRLPRPGLPRRVTFDIKD